MKVFSFQTIFLIKTLFSSIAQASYDKFDVTCNQDWKETVTTTTPFLKHFSFIGNVSNQDILFMVEDERKTEKLCSLVTIRKMSGKECQDIKEKSGGNKWDDAIISIVKRGAKYERMLNKSGMVIDPSQYPDGFALTVLNYNSTKPCESLDPWPSEHDVTGTWEKKTVKVKMSPNGTTEEYLFATLIPVAVFISIFIMVILFTCHKENKSRNPISRIQNTEIQMQRLTSTDQADKANVQADEPDEANIQEDEADEGSPKRDDSYRSSRQYLSLIFIIGFFYALPAWSAVRSKMDEIENTGNMDICFYNAYCRKPLGVFKDFGHVFSNIGYIILGITFFFVIQITKAKRRNSSFLDQCRWNFFSLGTPPLITPEQAKNGVLVQYGIYQALALALCMEGIMSSCYHVCPTNNNFQFDTTFMYIMGFLIFIKLYQNRHPNQTPSSITTFFIISTAMSFVVIQRYLPSIQSVHILFWVIFYAFYLAFVFYITFQKEDVLFRDSIKAIFQCGKNMCCGCWNTGEIQNIFTCVIFWFNTVLFLFDITKRLYITIQAEGEAKMKYTDVADVLLFIFVGNGIVYMIFYLITKCCLARKERSEDQEQKLKTAEFPGKFRFLFLLLGIGFIAAALFFFKIVSTDKEISPANSSSENHNCIDPFNFYDAHDIWHMLGAAGLFFLFLFLFTLDDRTSYQKRKKLDIF